jgi:hypothetical protein
VGREVCAHADFKVVGETPKKENEMFEKINLFLDGNDAGGGSASASASDANTTISGGELNFDGWYSEQDDTVKNLLQDHTKGLKTALESERESRKAFEKQIKDLAAKAEKGSETEKQLTLLSEQIESADRKTAFYEDAHAAGVTNLKLAFILASTEGLFDKKGNVNFVEMKSNYPELFGSKKAPAGNAGDGTEALPVPKSMNDFIRQAAGSK